MTNELFKKTIALIEFKYYFEALVLRNDPFYKKEIVKQ